MFTKWFGSCFKAIEKSQQQRADYWLLHNMTDKDLRDIGITRGEIHDRVFREQATLS